MKLSAHAFLGLALSISLTSAYAQAYRCIVDGQTVYQQAPCTGGSKLSTVPDPPDPNTREGRVALAIAKRQVFIGMTREEVIKSWGKPTKNNKSISARSTHEQWVYERDRISDTQYLYFEDGMLRTIQSPE